MDRLCLDAYYRYTHGDAWPEQWRWDLTSDPADRPGVTLDEYGRVVMLELDFGEDEGEARCDYGLR